MKKGFTLIELLAVIVILAIIALISTPIIINLIDDVRKESFKNSAYGIVKAGEYLYANDFMNETNEEVIFIYTDGVESSSIDGKELKYNGTKPQNGIVTINSEGKISIVIHNGTYCVEKGFDDIDVIINTKTQEDCLSGKLPDPTPPEGELANSLNDADSDGYLDIWYLEQLAYIDTNATTLAQNYELMRSLDFQNDAFYLDINKKALWTTGEGWKPIAEFNSREFEGELNGNNFSIRNLFIDRASSNNVALFAVIEYSTIENLKLESAIISGSSESSILVGRASGTSVIKNIYVSGSVAGNYYTGGVVGYATGELSLKDVHGSINIDSTGYEVGGIIGVYYNTSTKQPVENLFAEGTVSGVQYVGGVIGRVRGGISYANNLKSDIIVEGDNYVGGVVGNSAQATLEYTNSGATGEVIGGSETGGFIGRLSGGTISNSYSSANVIDGYGSNGGFIGAMNDGIIKTSYSTGNVSSSGMHVGGFVGEMRGSTSNLIENSYATGNVQTTNSRVGGFLGYRYSTPVTLTNVYAIGNVSGSSSLGGLVGTNATVSNNSYYDKNTTNQTSSAGGTGLTTTEMKQQSSYVSWDFTNIWSINPSKNNGYPYLKVFEENID